MNRSKAKGYAAEKLVADWLSENGYPGAERRVTSGHLDRGDISGVANVVIEVKDAQTLRLHEWLDETERERHHDSAEWGILVVKRYGSTDVAKWFAIQRVDAAVMMLREIEALRARVAEIEGDV